MGSYVPHGLTPAERQAQREYLARVGETSDACKQAREWSRNRWPGMVPPRIVPDMVPLPAPPAERCACGRRFWGLCSACHRPGRGFRRPREERRALALEAARDHARREEVAAWAAGILPALKFPLTAAEDHATVPVHSETEKEIP